MRNFVNTFFVAFGLFLRPKVGYGHFALSMFWSVCVWLPYRLYIRPCYGASRARSSMAGCAYTRKASTESKIESCTQSARFWKASS